MAGVYLFPSSSPSSSSVDALYAGTIPVGGLLLAKVTGLKRLIWPHTTARGVYRAGRVWWTHDYTAGSLIGPMHMGLERLEEYIRQLDADHISSGMFAKFSEFVLEYFEALMTFPHAHIFFDTN